MTGNTKERKKPSPAGEGFPFADKQKMRPDDPNASLNKLLDGSGYLARTKATGTDINMLGGAVNDSLNASYVGLPSTVASSV